MDSEFKSAKAVMVPFYLPIAFSMGGFRAMARKAAPEGGGSFSEWKSPTHYWDAVWAVQGSLRSQVVFTADGSLRNLLGHSRVILAAQFNHRKRTTYLLLNRTVLFTADTLG